MDTEAITTRIPKEMADQLRAIAAEKEWSLSQLMRKILNNYLKETQG